MIEEHYPSKHFNSIRIAVLGLKHAFKTQRNFRVELFVGFITLLFALALGLDRIEWIVLFLTIGAVLTAELANTILESVVDLSITRIHPKAKIAKDLSAAAVLVLSIISVVIGIMLFWPHLWMVLCKINW